MISKSDFPLSVMAGLDLARPGHASNSVKISSKKTDARVKPAQDENGRRHEPSACQRMTI
jgi:hypothetical protein